MLPRLLSFLPFFLLFSFRSFAQTYEPGLLVRSNGDTLRGEIENSFWVEPPTFIRFRSGAASPSQLFQPRQLRAVSFTNGRYFRYEALPIDHAAETRLQSLPRGYHPFVYLDSLLAEVLVEGPATLFRVAQPGATHYLLRRPGRSELDLSQRRYLRQTASGALAIADGNNYHDQLSLFFADCPAARTMVPATPFTAEGLAAVVQAYHATCSAVQRPGRSWLVQAAPRRRLAFRGGLLAGLRYNRTESNASRLAGPCVDCQGHPFAGLYAELLQPSRTAAIYGELSLSAFRGQGFQHFGTDASGAAVYNVFNYRGQLATARLGARFFFPLAREQQGLVSFGYELN